jgi:hypothetical protein
VLDGVRPPSPKRISDEISGRPRRRLFLYALRRPQLPPRAVKETVSGRADAISLMMFPFAQFID